MDVPLHLLLQCRMQGHISRRSYIEAKLSYTDMGQRVRLRFRTGRYVKFAARVLSLRSGD